MVAGVRVSVTLPVEVVEQLRVRGNGSVSKGVYLAEYHASRGTPTTSPAVPDALDILRQRLDDLEANAQAVTRHAVTLHETVTKHTAILNIAKNRFAEHNAILKAIDDKFATVDERLGTLHNLVTTR